MYCRQKYIDRLMRRPGILRGNEPCQVLPCHTMAVPAGTSMGMTCGLRSFGQFVLENRRLTEVPMTARHHGERSAIFRVVGKRVVAVGHVRVG